MKNFEHKVAIITGAASGFGLEFARKAAALKMRLVLADVAEDALNTAISSLSSTGCEVVGIRCDVSKGEEVEALAKLAIQSSSTR